MRIDEIQRFLTDWAAKHPAPARSLIEVLERAPEGGVNVYLPMRFPALAASGLPTKPAELQMKPQLSHGTSELPKVEPAHG